MTDLWVEMDDPKGNKMRIPASGEATSIAHLITLVDVEVNALTAQGYDYKDKLTKQALSQNLPYRAYLAVIIENMMCKRRPNPEETCFSDGVGDHFQFLSGKIDRIVASLGDGVLGRAASLAVRAATLAATGHASQTMAGCTSCGGTKSISPVINNLGRAGKLNRILRSRT